MDLLSMGLILLDVLCYTGQSAFRKLYSLYGGEKATPSLFSILYGTVVGFTAWVMNGFAFHPDGLTWGLGLGAGAFLFLFNIVSVNGEKNGPFMMLDLFSTFGCILLTLGLNVCFLNDKLNLLKLIGLVLILAALVLYSTSKGAASRGNHIFRLCLVLIFLANGLYSVFVNLQNDLENGLLQNEFIMIAFWCSTVLSVGYALLFPAGHVSLKGLPGKSWFFAILSSLCAAGAIILLMVCLQRVPGSIYYPTANGLLLIAKAAFAVIALKELPTSQQWVGLLFALAGVILMNI